MARMRSLRPDFFLREDMADVSLEAHFLLGGLAVLADRDGRLLDRPRTIKAQVFPFRDVDVERALGELVAAGVLARYTAGGKAVLALLTWEEDQTPHPKETSNGLPPPDSAGAVAFHATPQPSGKVPDGSGNIGDGSGRDPLGLGIGCGSRDGSGMGVGSSASQATASAAPPEDIPDATEHAEVVEERPQLAQVGLRLGPARALRKRPERPHGDARHATLVAELVRAFSDARRAVYGFQGGRDAKLVTELLALADQDERTRGAAAPGEVLRRWRIALGWDGFPACATLADLKRSWNYYATPQPQRRASGWAGPAIPSSLDSFDRDLPGGSS